MLFKESLLVTFSICFLLTPTFAFSKKHDRRNDGFVDAFPCKSVLARFINDPRIEENCNVKFEHIKEPGTWHCPVISQRDIEAGEELFISYGPRYWEGRRKIGG